MAKKRVATLVMSIALLLAVTVGGTLAYLTDTDADVNVMTLGNVQIEQHEYQRATNEDGTYKTDTIDNQTSYVLEPFEQAKPLYPATDLDANGQPYNYGAGDYDSIRAKMSQVGSHGSMDVFVNENAQDKFVTVENTGKSDAYVRTLIAFELGSLNESEFNDVIMTSSFMTDQGVWKVTDIGTVEIDNNNYFVCEYLYNGAKALGGVHENGVLPAGDTTYPSLAQVYMKATATNEDVEAIDGNNNGTYDILVLSQAVQVAGFEDAKTALNAGFGEATAANVAAWFAGEDGKVEIPTVIDDADEAYEASLTSGEYVLGADIKTSDAENHFSNNREYAIKNGTEVVLNLNGHTINHDGTYQDGNNTGYTYLVTTAYNGKLTVNGEGTVNSANSEGRANIFYAQSTSEIVINGGDYSVDKGIAVWAGNGSKITINGGSFVSTGAAGDEELIYSSGGVIDIYGGFFHNEEWEERPVNVADANRSTGRINIYGGTFVNFDPSTGGNDPGQIKVVEGYKVVSETQANGDVWYTVVAE